MRLTATEQKMVREALHAMAYGPFIADWELPLRCSGDRPGYQAILSRWPDLDDSNRSDVFYAINGALSECCHAYEMEVAPWEEWFTVPRDELLTTFERWDELHAEAESEQ
jgi:hypothetical protein